MGKNESEEQNPRQDPRELQDGDQVKFAITIMGTGTYSKEDDKTKDDIKKFFNDNQDYLTELLKANAKISVNSQISFDSLSMDIGQVQEN